MYTDVLYRATAVPAEGNIAIIIHKMTTVTLWRTHAEDISFNIGFHAPLTELHHQYSSAEPVK